MARVMASHRFLWLVLGALALVCAVALDVPQQPDGRILADYPHATGPYLVTLGLNSLGRSVLVWVLLVGLAGHLVAAAASRSGDAVRAGAPEGVSTPVAVAGAILTAVAVIGLLAAPAAEPGPSARSATRLTVVVPAPGGAESVQAVEEGVPYAAAGPGGDRALVFGTTDAGPYAFERTQGGTLRAHLPGAGGAAGPGLIRVLARRPPAAPAARPLLPPVAGDMAAVAVALAAGWLMVAAVRRARMGDLASRPAVAAAVLASGAGLAASPLVGPGRAVVEVAAGALGTPVRHLVEVAGPGDVGTWVGYFPATARLALPFSLGVAAAVAALAGLVTLARRGAGSRGLPVRAAGWLWVAAGAVTLAYAVGRIPIATGASNLVGQFHEDILPRIAMNMSVVRHEPSAVDPYTVSPGQAIAMGVAFLAPGLAALLLARREATSGPTAAGGWADAWPVTLAALLVARAAAVALGPADAVAPAGAVPVSLVAAVVAAACIGIRRVHGQPVAGMVGVVAGGLALLGV